jgi:hypothetical protein
MLCRARFTVVLCAIALVALPSAALAQDKNKDKEENTWSNDTELSSVATWGNSNVFTLGFKNLYQQWWGAEKNSRFQIKLEGTKSDKADDRFVVATLDPNQPIDPGIPCSSAGAICATIEPPVEDDIERYLVEGKYNQNFSKRTFWQAGASWDRNLTDGSGILNRYIGFGGIGNIWWDSEELKFSTNYALSYTDRDETTPDPLKEDQFIGLRFDWSYLNQWGKNVTYNNTWTINASLQDSQDYNFDMVNGISVAMTERVALKVSLQWLFNNEPPLNTVDLDCANPDPNDPRQTVPCNLICVDDTGAIVACTDPGSTQLNDETDIRKDQSDVIFNTSLVIKL